MTDAPSGEESLTTRLLPLYGQEGLSALAAARVLVIGLGGVGSSCAEALARGGIGELFLVDRDVVEPSNLNRQALAFTSTVGRRKVDVMREMVGQVNPSCRVETRHAFVAKDDLAELLTWAGAGRRGEARPGHDGGAVPRLAPGRLTCVVDAIDTMSQKLALAQLCWEDGIPLVSSMGGANKVRPELLEFADVRKTRVCRVARTMRKECAKRGIRHLEVLYSPEEPVRPRAEAGSSHGGLTNLGTASFMPPIMGQMIAGRVIRAIVGLEPWRWQDRDRGEGEQDGRGAAGTQTAGGHLAPYDSPRSDA